MNSILEQLLEFASPIFAAVASGKKRTVRKPAQKRVIAKLKRVARTRSKKSAVKTKRAATRKPSKRKTVARKSVARKPSAASKKKSARPTAPTKPELRKGVPPAKPEPKIVVPPPPPPKPVRPAGRPILLSPENGKYADSVNPKFRWLSVGSATRYEVVWSQDMNLINGYSIVSVATEATVPVEKPLAIGVTYFWHVRGGNEAGWGPWSAPASFSVLEEEPA